MCARVCVFERDKDTEKERDTEVTCVAATVCLGAVRAGLAHVVVTARLAAIVRAAAAADIAHVAPALITGHWMRLPSRAGALKPVSDPQ